MHLSQDRLYLGRITGAAGDASKIRRVKGQVAVDPARRRWPNVAAAVGTRSTTQCRSHAQKYSLCGNQTFV